MNTVAFDTVKFVERLEAGGFSHAQAKPTAEAFADATNNRIVTNAALPDELAPVKVEQMLLKWMVGFNLAATVGVFYS